MTKRDATKLDVFLHKSLRRLMLIYWPMKISNEEIRNRANISTISEQIFRRRWTFIDHVLRMDPRRRSGRPKENGGERQKKKEQHWALSRGAGQQWLLVTGPIPT